MSLLPGTSGSRDLDWGGGCVGSERGLKQWIWGVGAGQGVRQWHLGTWDLGEWEVRGGRKLGQGVGTSLQILELQDMLRPSTVPGTQDIT